VIKSLQNRRAVLDIGTGHCYPDLHFGPVCHSAPAGLLWIKITPLLLPRSNHLPVKIQGEVQICNRSQYRHPLTTFFGSGNKT